MNRVERNAKRRAYLLGRDVRAFLKEFKIGTIQCLPGEWMFVSDWKGLDSASNLFA